LVLIHLSVGATIGISGFGSASRSTMARWRDWAGVCGGAGQRETIANRCSRWRPLPCGWWPTACRGCTGFGDWIRRQVGDMDLILADDSVIIREGLPGRW